MNYTDINDSVLDMTVSQMNLCSPSPSRRTTSPQSTIKLITWKDTQSKQQIEQNEQIEQNLLTNVSKNTCLPFTVNLIDNEQKFEINNNHMNIIEQHENNACLDTIPEEESTCASPTNANIKQLPTIVEETEEPHQLLTIKEAISLSRMCDTDDDQNPKETPKNEEVYEEVYEEVNEEVNEEINEQINKESVNKFRSSSPFNEPDANPIKIRHETIHSMSFDILPVPQTERKSSEQDTDDSNEMNNEQETTDSQNDEIFDDYKYEKRKATHRKDTKILDKFLKEKKGSCRLEMEIIANDARAETGASNLQLYRVSSSEIVIRGDRCIDALNKSFSRNKIKHVNIVFVNEETKDESEITLQSDLNAKKCRDSFVINAEKCAGKLTGSKDRAHETDHFWRQCTQNNDYISENNNDDDDYVDDVDDVNDDVDDVDDDDDDNVDDDDDDNDDSEHSLFLPPINIKKKDKHESQRFISNTPTRFPPIYDEKNQSTNHQKEKDDYDPFLIAEKQLMELLEGDDFKPYKTPSPKVKLRSLSDTKAQKSSNNTQKQNSLQDNFEMIENLINDNYLNNTNEIKRKLSDEINSIDPKLINENDNLKIPDELLIENSYSPISYTNYTNDTNDTNDVDHYSAQYDKNISMLEPLVLPKTEMKRSASRLSDADFEAFISSFDDDDGFPALKHFLNTPVDVKHTKKKSLNCSFGKSITRNENKKHPLSPLKRSVSLSNPVVKARSMKNKQDIQDYLHVREQKSVSRDRDRDREKLKTLVSPRSSDELFPVGHDMYNEYKKYEEMYRREQHDEPQHLTRDENDEMSSEEQDSTPPLQPSAVTNSNSNSHHTKMNAADSAYGSLNRKSTKIQPKKMTVSAAATPAPTTTQHVKRSPSSSGSETCTSIPAKKGNRVTKFCHECGTKYPLDSAKFCVECGIKRLVL